METCKERRDTFNNCAKEAVKNVHEKTKQWIFCEFYIDSYATGVLSENKEGAIEQMNKIYDEPIISIGADYWKEGDYMIPTEVNIYYKNEIDGIELLGWKESDHRPSREELEKLIMDFKI